MRNHFLLISVAIFLSSCSSFLKTDVKLDDFKKNNEFEQMVKVKKTEPVKSADLSPPVKKIPVLKPVISIKKHPIIKTKAQKKAIKKIVKVPKRKLKPHKPSIENPVGFDGRRPLVDPFRVGELVELTLNYMNMTAGKLTFRVLPMVEVNGKKAYNFQVKLVSSKMFAWFYKLNNVADTYVDYNQMVPFTHEVHINESKQIKEAKSFYNWKTLMGNYWEKRITDDGETNKKKTWKLKSYSQNLISALFYLRTFTSQTGKKFKFRVADAGKAIILSGTVLKKEKIKTAIGEIETYKVKVEYEVDGTFQQDGDVYFWLSADERKFIVRIQSKIKIGSLYGDVSLLKK